MNRIYFSVCVYQKMWARMITYQYAQSDDDSTKYINQVSLEYRKNHHFICYGCGGRMIARLKADKREPHFAHFRDGTCSRETYLHHLGKKLFVEMFEHYRNNKISLSVNFLQQGVCNSSECPLGAKSPCEGSTRTGKFNLLPDYSKCTVEEYDKETGFRPDILLTNENGDKVYVEILVTHEITQKKIDSGVPIIEIPIYDEDDLELFKCEKNVAGVSFLEYRATCYNLPNKTFGVERFCLNKISSAKKAFKEHYERILKTGSPLNILLQRDKSCQRESCPYQLTSRCEIDDEGELFNLAGRFKKIVEIDNGLFSSDLYLEDDKGIRIRINFALEVAVKQSFDKGERVIQFVFGFDAARFPWEYQSPLHYSWETRFYNFKERPFPNCENIKFQIFALFKNGFLYDSASVLNIKEIESKLKEFLPDVREYILLDSGFINAYSSEDEYRLLRTAIRLYQKYGYQVKSCLLCAYCHDTEKKSFENDGKIFCHKFHKECSLDEYPGCSSFAYGMAHYYSASNGFLPVGAMEDCAYRNRIIFVDDFLQNERETAKS